MTAKDLLATNQYSKISAIEHRYTQNLDRFVSDEMSGSITCNLAGRQRKAPARQQRHERAAAVVVTPTATACHPVQ
jgi:hypothetical protein